MMGRHPRKIDLATWFDGEGSDRVGGHVLRCHRCQRHVDELARLRSWLRAQPFVAMRDPDDAPSPVPERRRARRPLVAAAALVATVMVVAESGDAPSGLDAASSGTTTTMVERTDRITVVDVPEDDLRPLVSELATPEGGGGHEGAPAPLALGDGLRGVLGVAHRHERLRPQPRPQAGELVDVALAALAAQHVRADPVAALAVEPGGEVELARMAGHQRTRFDARSLLALRRAAWRRDITVPTGTPCTSAISA